MEMSASSNTVGQHSDENPKRLSARSSLAYRVETAGIHVPTKVLWTIIFTIVSIIAFVNTLSYVIIEYGIFQGNGDIFGELSKTSGVGIEFDLGMTDKIPLSSLSDRDFLCYITIVMWATMVLTGIGTEFLVWLMFLGGGWDQDKENKWRIAQFLFPLLGATTVGLANTHNYLAFPFLVVTMWKFGFPETVLLIYASIYDDERSFLARFVDFLNGAGTVLHHEATALYVAAVVTNLIPTNRVVLQVTIPLLMQHWFVLMRYGNKWAYAAIEIILEVWFEWNAFAAFEILHKLHWTGGIIAACMLIAHWLYFIAGGLSLLLSEEEGHADFGTDENIERLKMSKMQSMKWKIDDIIEDEPERVLNSVRFAEEHEESFSDNKV